MVNTSRFNSSSLSLPLNDSICGHLIEDGNPVQTRLVILVGEITGVSMVEGLDGASGHLVVKVDPLK